MLGIIKKQRQIQIILIVKRVKNPFETEKVL